MLHRKGKAEEHRFPQSWQNESSDIHFFLLLSVFVFGSPDFSEVLSDAFGQADLKMRKRILEWRIV